MNLKVLFQLTRILRIFINIYQIKRWEKKIKIKEKCWKDIYFFSSLLFSYLTSLRSFPAKEFKMCKLPEHFNVPWYINAAQVMGTHHLTWHLVGICHSMHKPNNILTMGPLTQYMKHPATQTACTAYLNYYLFFFFLWRGGLHFTRDKIIAVYCSFS